MNRTGQNQKLLDHQESQEQIDNLKKQELSKIKHLLLIKDQEFEALKVQMLEQQQKIAILTEENSQLQQVQVGITIFLNFFFELKSVSNLKWCQSSNLIGVLRQILSTKYNFFKVINIS